VDEINFVEIFMEEMRKRNPKPSFPKSKKGYTWRMAAYIRY